jgi:tRNA pseudouridine32 synthase/23S rRNA pseudouridine746 synthase
MLYTGHPILGDGLYAHEQALNAKARLCLHATDLTITQPVSKKTLEFFSVAPF